MKARLTAALLAALMILLAAGCGGTPSSDGTSDVPGGQTEDPSGQTGAGSTAEATTVQETAYIDTLEKRDLQEKIFTVIGQSTNERQNFFTDDKAGDVINESIRKRDFAVEDRLNVHLNYVAEKDRKKVTTAVQAAVRTGDKSYDLVINSLSDGINTLTTAGDLLDLNTIPGLSLNSIYWNQSMTVNMEMYGRLYFTTGPVSPQLYQTPIVMMMNKKIASEYKLEDPYKVVLEGRWTIDKLAEMMKDVSHDLDQDNVMGEQDFWGLVIDPTFGNALYVGSGLEARQFTDGKYRIAIGDEGFVNLVDKCSRLFGDRRTVLNNPQGAKDYDLDIFLPGRALFIDDTVLGVLSVRDMEDDFAIIPCPKAAADQEKYYTTCNTWLPSGVAVPRTNEDPEDTGLIMETMAVYSYEYVVPTVYDIMLRGRVIRDADDCLTLDIIFENLSFDFVSVFNPGGASDLLRNAMIGEQTNYVSALASIQRQVQRALDDFAAIAQKEN